MSLVIHIILLLFFLHLMINIVTDDTITRLAGKGETCRAISHCVCQSMSSLSPLPAQGCLVHPHSYGHTDKS